MEQQMETSHTVDDLYNNLSDAADKANEEYELLVFKTNNERLSFQEVIHEQQGEIKKLKEENEKLETHIKGSMMISTLKPGTYTITIEEDTIPTANLTKHS